MKLTTISKVGGVLAASVLALTACGVSNEGGNSGGGGDETAAGGGSEVDWSDCTPGEESADTSSMEADSDTDITIGAFDGWDESFAAAHLYKYLLEQDGYTADVQSFQAGPGYTGLAEGDIDVILDGWLPLTHADYLEQYGEDIEAHGCWYDNAKLTLAVNEDSPAQSIADLAEMGDEYGNRIVGIEAGAGLTKTTEESAIPTYGLEDYEFIVSSTPAMLSELKKATDSGDNILVTLWRPHWAYDAFPVRDLEDPEGAMGEAELIYNFTRSGFSDDHPKAGQLLKNLVIDDEALSSLENVMFSEENYNGEDLDGAVEEWAGDNAEFFENWKSGSMAG